MVMKATRHNGRSGKHRMELIVRSLAEQNGVTEQLKAENQMEWVRQMNACKDSKMTVELFTSFMVKFEYKLSNKSGKT